MKKLPRRFAHPLFSLLVSGLMSSLVSGVATLKTLGPVAGLVDHWMAAWGSSWLVAFPAILVVAPLVRRFVARVTE